MNKTTLQLDDAVMQQIRDLAHQSKRTLTEIINDLLVESLVRRKQQSAKVRLKPLPSWPAGTPRVNIADRNALYDLLEQDDKYVGGR
jgi:hypothetical protein